MKYVHLAGTNAKGSTAQYVAEILSQSHQCGLFTSPHIISPCERMRINGKMIAQKKYDVYMKNAKGEHDSHLFCVWTRAALAWFEDQEVQYAVIETGLGGRCDPTNVIPAQMQILTPISYDHMELLGHTLTEIAHEKCGIIKKNSLVISHPQDEEAMRVIRQTCNGMNAALIVLNEKNIRLKNSGLMGQCFDFSYNGQDFKELHIDGISPMQVDNACVAIMAAAELGIAKKEIIDGIENTRIQARVQRCNDVIIDGAHNSAAMDELANTIKKHFKKQHITVLCAVMQDKDIMSITKRIEDFADDVVCTCADNKRGISARELKQFFIKQAVSIENPEYAYESAMEIVSKKKGILVVCGSFYLAAHILKILGKEL